MNVPTIKRFTSTTFASLAILAGILSGVSFFLPVQRAVRVTDRHYLVPHFYDGRFRLFWINSEDAPLRVEALEGSQHFIVGVDKPRQPSTDTEPPGQRGGRRFLLRIGNLRSVPDFGGAVQEVRKTRSGRVFLPGVKYTFFRIPAWLLMLALLLPPIYFIFNFPWLYRRRKRRNRCTSCGYSLVALTEPRCPECGYDVSPQKLENCRGCGYDLTGNVSGACPECGLSLAGI